MKDDRELLALMAALVVLALVPPMLEKAPEDLVAAVVEQTDQVDLGDSPDPELEEPKVTVMNAGPGSYALSGKPAATEVQRRTEGFEG